MFESNERWMIITLCLVLGILAIFFLCMSKINTERMEQLCAPYSYDTRFCRGDREYVVCGDDSVRLIDEEEGIPEE